MGLKEGILDQLGGFITPRRFLLVPTQGLWFKVRIINKLRISVRSYISDCGPEMSSSMEYSEVSAAI